MTSKYNQFDNAAMATETTANTSDVPMINVGYNQQNTMGYTNQLQNTTMVQIHQPEYEVVPRYPWCHFVMSIITLIIGILCICNPVTWIFSILGLVYSSNAYSSHGEKLYEKSNRQNHVAKVFWIISLVFLIIFVVVWIVAIIVVVSTIYSTEQTVVHSFSNTQG